MRSHYIPQFVLREFADENGLVSVYDRAGRTVRQSTPKNTFVISGFYDDFLEKLLAGLEGKLSAGMKSVLGACWSNMPFTMPDTRVLELCRQVVLLQLLRTPYAKEAGMQALADVSVESLIQKLAEAGYENVGEEVVRRSVERWQQDGAKTRESKLWSLTLLQFLQEPAQALPGAVPAILDKGVVLARTQSAFVVGDRGAVSTATNSSPLFDPDREIFFPVSPYVAVSLAGRRDRIHRTVASRDETREINLSTLACSKWVVSHSSRLLRSLANPR